MNIGILKEKTPGERRVGLTPSVVRALVAGGHTLFVEKGAGSKSFFEDEEYASAGAKIVEGADELIGRSKLIVKVSPLLPQEYERLVLNQVVVGFMHMAIASDSSIREVIDKKVTIIGYEIIENTDGELPILIPMSEIAGQVCVQIAAHYLQGDQGGRGLLVGGMPGVPPAVFVIAGAGVVGTEAARTAIGLGAQVIVLDRDVEKLRRIDELFGKRVITSVATHYNLERAVKFADVFIGAVLVHGEKAPILVTRQMVSTMKKGTVIVDVSIDQGGCIETSRPTSSENPVFIEEGVIHYCIPYIPSVVGRTATRALSNATLPYITQIAQHGIEEAVKSSAELARGVYFYKGRCAKPGLSQTFGIGCNSLQDILEGKVWLGDLSL
ncbi:MAG: alanine dehydrogenase [Candidatus Glassbacteria bacterium]